MKKIIMQSRLILHLFNFLSHTSRSYIFVPVNIRVRRAFPPNLNGRCLGEYPTSVNGHRSRRQAHNKFPGPTAYTALDKWPAE